VYRGQNVHPAINEGRKLSFNASRGFAPVTTALLEISIEMLSGNEVTQSTQDLKTTACNAVLGYTMDHSLNTLCIRGVKKQAP